MKIIKKILVTVLLILFVAIGGLTINTAHSKAATDAKITVSSTNGYGGDTVTVDILVSENPGMCAMTIGVKYDKTVLSVVDAVGVDDVFSSNDAVINPNGDGFVGYMYAGLKDKTATGKLLTITFKINESAGIADSVIEVGDINGIMEASNFNGDTIGIAVESGKITVKCRHDSVKDIERVAATCTTEGSKETVCEKCDAVIKTVAIPALGHKYGEYTTTKEPTCTEEGEATSTCAVCGDKHTKILEALGHKYDKYTTTKEPTCTEKGEATSTCAVCGDKHTKILEALGHKYDKYTTTKEPTCTEKGEATSACAVCGDKHTKILEALGHNCDNVKVTKEPTDKEVGEAMLICASCGEKFTTVIPKINTVDFNVLDSEGKEFLNEVTVGEKTTITLVGVGISNELPKLGDVRYIPISWNLGKEILWETAPYTATIEVFDIGDKNLITVYGRQIYNGTEWIADGKTISVSTAIRVSENTSADSVVPTGDKSGAAVTVLFMICVISVGVLIMTSKKRKNA